MDWQSFITPEVIARFWSKVDKSGGEDACWPWLAGFDKDGYGKFQFSIVLRSVSGKQKQQHVRSHRFALFLRTGEWPPAVLHRCSRLPSRYWKRPRRSR